MRLSHVAYRSFSFKFVAAATPTSCSRCPAQVARTPCGRRNQVATATSSVSIHSARPSNEVSVAFVNACLRPESVVIRLLFEAQPSMRLKRLLDNARFDEAEKFAVKYGLDLQVCGRTRAAVKRFLFSKCKWQGSAICFAAMSSRKSRTTTCSAFSSRLTTIRYVTTRIYDLVHCISGCGLLRGRTDQSRLLQAHRRHSRLCGWPEDRR